MSRKRTGTKANGQGGAAPAPLRAPPSVQVPVPGPAPRAVVVAPEASPLRPVVIDEQAVFTLLGLLAAAALLWSISSVLLPLLFVGVATFIGAPVVQRLEARGVPRSVGAGVVVVGAMLAVAGLVALVVPALVSDLVALFERAPAALTALARKIELTFGIAIPNSVRDLSDLAAGELVEQLSPVAATGGAIMKQGALGLYRGAATALGFVLQALLVPVITFFVLSELPEVKRMVWSLWPARARPAARRYGPLVDDALTGLIRGQVTVALIMAVIYAVGLGIAGVPLTLAIAVLAGAAYLIPFASGTVCLVLAVAFSLAELGTEALGPIIGAAITAGVVQILEGYVLTPRIVGEKAGLSPLAALLAVLFGGSAAGFLGVLFALPVGAVAAIVIRDIAARAAPVPSAEPSKVTA